MQGSLVRCELAAGMPEKWSTPRITTAAVEHCPVKPSSDRLRRQKRDQHPGNKESRRSQY